MIVIICVFEFLWDNSRSKLVFMMDLSYYGSFVILDVLLLCKFEYYSENEDIRNFLENLITLLIYFLIGMLILKVIWEFIPWKSLKNLCA